MMQYTILHTDNTPDKVRYEPDFVDSEGFYNAKLGVIAIKVFTPKGWRWQGKYLYRDTLNADPNNLVVQAQAEVTDMMDMLAEWEKFSKIFEEYKGV